MRRFIPVFATFAVLIALFATASGMYERFFTARVIANLFSDNAFLGITAIGMTFVILSGGIDLSVGAVLAFTMTFIASMITDHSWHPLVAIPTALIIGTVFGGTMGFLIQRYELPPFLVTLAGMFFARGMAFMVSSESISIEHDFYTALQDLKIVVGPKAKLKIGAVIFLAVLALAIFVAHWTPFGRNIYAIGGNESSARLMGLPVASTKMLIYALNGFCSALAGAVATLYMGSGNPAMGVGLELDAIAAVVIGGTLLTGGVGFVAGTLGGVLIFGTIQSALIFDGRLNSWWLRIAISVLLLIFILLQRQLSRFTKTSRT
ncbi:MAG: sugar ABC transporter permease YjfF [Verrucomicrobiales bacterium]|nr:sugar ABC transporter permease YjfF [Verrucomicrobiales bacterium]|tara:strand:+ start:4072 stop:5031 length:960 start_codon:yes stop_codon:yes gene_type:complete